MTECRVGVSLLLESLKTKDRQFDNFVVTVGIIGDTVVELMFLRFQRVPRTYPFESGCDTATSKLFHGWFSSKYSQ